MSFYVFPVSKLFQKQFLSKVTRFVKTFTRFANIGHFNLWTIRHTKIWHFLKRPFLNIQIKRFFLVGFIRPVFWGQTWKLSLLSLKLTILWTSLYILFISFNDFYSLYIIICFSFHTFHSMHLTMLLLNLSQYWYVTM